MEIRLFFSIEVNVLQTVLAGLVITACVWAFILKQILIGFREGGVLQNECFLYFFVWVYI